MIRNSMEAVDKVSKRGGKDSEVDVWAYGEEEIWHRKLPRSRSRDIRVR